MSERGGGISLPGAPQQMPNLPENFSPVIFEQFATLNTKPLRPGIRDEEMSWCDGFMPIGPNNARILPGTGQTILSDAPHSWFNFGNLQSSYFCYVLRTSGAIQQIDMDTLDVTQVAPNGTVSNPTSVFGFSQWGSKYIIFANDQTNGYWLWDGSSLFTAGTLGPEVSIDNAGDNYSGSPNYVVHTTGSGSGVQLSFEVQNNSVVQATVTNPGSGFSKQDLIAVSLQGGGSDDQAYCSPVTVHRQTGGLSEVFVLKGGRGYTGFAYATITPVDGNGMGASVSLAIQNGTITGVAIVKAGQGFTQPPDIEVVDPGIPGSGGSAIPGGIGGQIGSTVAFGQIQNINIAFNGSGYTSPPTLKILGDGVDAAGVATIENGNVTGIVMSNLGSGYTRALAVLEGGNNAANITVTLMPYGISGTAVEVYQDHVWVTNGGANATFPPQNRTIFSDPGSPVGFGNGGGAFASNDSFLRVGYHALRQSNGFLYLIGDSSLNYISGVQTSSSGTSSVPSVPITTFGNLNVDPQIGSPWPGSVQVFSRNIMFANTVGIHVSYGGAVKKVSDPLDGFYATGQIFGNNDNFTSAVAHIFAIPVYMLLLPVQDLFTGQVVNKLLMWDGKKWFTSQQDRDLQFIQTFEQNSILTAYGSDGNDIFQLFARPRTTFQKVIQSKLFAHPAYYSTKTSRSLSGIVFYYNTDNVLRVTIDTEVGQGTGNAEVPLPVGGAFTWFNNHGNVVSWTNASNQPFTWNGENLAVFGPIPVAQQGRLMGMTVQTHASDAALLSLMLSDQTFVSNV